MEPTTQKTHSIKDSHIGRDKARAILGVTEDEFQALLREQAVRQTHFGYKKEERYSRFAIERLARERRGENARHYVARPTRWSDVDDVSEVVTIGPAKGRTGFVVVETLGSGGTPIRILYAKENVFATKREALERALTLVLRSRDTEIDRHDEKMRQLDGRISDIQRQISAAQSARSA